MSDQVPEGWKQGKFGDLAKVQNGYAFKSSDFSDVGYAAAIRMSNLKLGRVDLSDAKYVHDSVVRGLEQFRLRAGDFLFGMSGSIDNYAWVKKQDGLCYLNQRVGCLRNKPNTDPLFTSYCYLSETVRREITGLAAGAAQLNISGNQLEAISVPLPPLPEQKKIAAILLSVDEVIEKTRAQINKLKDLKTGMMQELLTKGIGLGGVPHTEFKASPLGKIPAVWKVATVESLLSNVPNPMRSGPFGSALLKKELVTEGIPFLGIDNVHVEFFRQSFKRFITEDKFKELKRYEVFPGDVMVTIMGTVGRCCVVPDGVGKTISSKHVWTITLDKDKYVPELLCWQINYANWVKQQFKNESQGGVMDSISSGTLKNLVIPVPPIDEQRKIVKVYRGLTSSIEKKESKLCSIQSLKKALMQDLLTGKVRVQIDTHELAEA